MQNKVTHWNLIRVVAIENKIICLLQKGKEYFVFLSVNGSIIAQKKTYSLNIAEQYFQSFLKRHDNKIHVIQLIKS